MWYLIFVVFGIDGLPLPPSNLGSFQTEAACTRVAKQMGAEVSRIRQANYRWMCVDQNGNW